MTAAVNGVTNPRGKGEGGASAQGRGRPGGHPSVGITACPARESRGAVVRDGSCLAVQRRAAPCERGLQCRPRDRAVGGVSDPPSQRRRVGDGRRRSITARSRERRHLHRPRSGWVHSGRRRHDHGHDDRGDRVLSGSPHALRATRCDSGDVRRRGESGAHRIDGGGSERSRADRHCVSGSC